MQASPTGLGKCGIWHKGLEGGDHLAQYLHTKAKGTGSVPLKKSNSRLDGADLVQGEEDPGSSGVGNHPQELYLLGRKEGQFLLIGSLAKPRQDVQSDLEKLSSLEGSFTKRWDLAPGMWR